MKGGVGSAVAATVQARLCLVIVFAKQTLTVILHFAKKHNRQYAADLVDSKPHGYSLSTIGWSLSAQRLTSKR